MRFGEYLAEHGITQVTAARELDCNKTYVSRLAAGLAEPSMGFARKVRNWSKGTVSLEDWPDRELIK